MRHNNFACHVRTVAFAVAATLVTASILPSPAAAEIVYHATDIAISRGAYNLDLNGDGITDFTITSKIEKFGLPCPDFSAVLTETPAAGNGAIVGPLSRGVEIGANQSFSADIATMSSVWWYTKLVIKGNDAYCEVASHGEDGTWWGKTGYLGLSFQVSGQTYYGWAQLSCPKSGGSGTLLGYAYETIPGRTIFAGETSYAWLSSTRLSFGTLAIGTSLTRSVTLENLGLTTLTITSAGVTGANASDFAALNSPPCSGTLAAGAKCSLILTFTPSSVGKESATYSVYSNGGESPQVLTLTGKGQ